LQKRHKILRRVLIVGTPYLEQLQLQPIAFRMAFNSNLQSQSLWSLFNGTWQTRPGELDHRLRFENEESTFHSNRQSLLECRLYHTPTHTRQTMYHTPTHTPTHTRHRLRFENEESTFQSNRLCLSLPCHSHPSSAIAECKPCTIHRHTHRHTHAHTLAHTLAHAHMHTPARTHAQKYTHDKNDLTCKEH